MEQLGKLSGKVDFMPDAAVVESLRYLENKGIPGNKNEDYKYCNTEAIIRKEFKSLENSFNDIKSVDAYKLEGCINIVVANGNYNETLSDSATEFSVSTFDKADKSLLSKHLGKYADVSSDAFIALNTAFSNNGIVIHIKKAVQKPLHIINIISAKTESFINPRQLVVVENNCEAKLIESFVSDGASAKVFHNHLTEVLVGENSHLHSYRIQNESDSLFQLNTTQVFVKKYGNYITNTFTFGGSLVRNNLNVVLDSDSCEAHLNGLFFGKGAQLIDNHTLVDHRYPECPSNELYKGIVKDKATGIFNGKIYVRKDAQKTNAYQSSKNILLSDDATINTKPQLEIYANDVKCSHGTSTGKIDEDALFYLKARGIGEESARKLLLQAFAGEVIDKIEIKNLKERVTELFEKAI